MRIETLSHPTLEQGRKPRVFRSLKIPAGPDSILGSPRVIARPNILESGTLPVLATKGTIDFLGVKTGLPIKEKPRYRRSRRRRCRQASCNDPDHGKPTHNRCRYMVSLSKA